MNESNKLSTEKIKSQRIDSKWDDAIRDAESEIHSLAVQKARLEQAVRIFKLNKRDGIPWPGEQQKSPQEGG